MLKTDMNYLINLVPLNFSRKIDEAAAINLASVIGLFTTFKYQINGHRSRQMIPFLCISAVFMANLRLIFRSVFWFWSLFTLGGRQCG